MSKKEIEWTRAIIIVLIIVLAVLMNSCTDPYEIEEIPCDNRIEYWENVLQVELQSGNENRIVKIEMIIQKIKEECK